MQVKIFNIPLSDDGVYLAEMNKFMAANKVLKVEQQLMSDFTEGWAVGWGETGIKHKQYLNIKNYEKQSKQIYKCLFNSKFMSSKHL